MEEKRDKIAAIVLAAGMSIRMGQPKLALPWKGTTILSTVLSTLHCAGVHPIVVVTGGNLEAVNKILDGVHFPIRRVFNPEFLNGEMLDSIKVGIRDLGANVDGTLIALGDQPQLQIDILLKIVDTYRRTNKKIIMPSYKMRRGHPWLVDKSLWNALVEISSGKTMRDFFTGHAKEIEYVLADSAMIFDDIDTPEDYMKARDKQSQ